MKVSRIGLSVVLVMSFQAPGFAVRANSKGQSNSNSGLLPIDRSYINPDLVNVLFPIDSNESNTTNGNGDNNSKSNNPGSSNSNNDRGRVTTPQNKKPDTQSMSRAMVDEQFRCNIFENTPYEDILSAVNSLNQAVNSPNCGGSKIDVKSITDNNKKIADAVTSLRGFVDNPESIQSENAADIVNNVDMAIRAANSLATTFASSDLLNEQCRQQMNGGQIASSLSDIMNGLTPYALMAAQLTGGTAAIPFIVGGAVITGAIGSMGKIIEENSVKIHDGQVRRAIIENTCQFIRLDQKYKFLIKSRNEQMKKITEDLSTSQTLFSTQLKFVSNETQSIVKQKEYLDNIALDLSSRVGAAQPQLDLDKQFLKSTSDEIKMCQLGIQMAVLSSNKESYIATMLTSLDAAMQAYGTTNVAQAQALKASADIAIQNLQAMAQKQFSINSSFKGCAKVTASFVETIDKAGSLSKQLVKLAQANIEKRVAGSSDYGLLKQRLKTLSEKQIQAERVAGSLENLRRYATSITQSEIDSEMDRLRKGLLAPRTMGIQSPVTRWFTYVRGLHLSDVNKFKQGLDNLRGRAYNMTASGKAAARPSFSRAIFGSKVDPKDQANAYQLLPFNLETLPLGTQEHDAACREMQDVWNRWVTAVDHLTAMDSFCSMIEPYIYDNRSEDRGLVSMCRGYTVASGGSFGPSLSMIAKLKNDLVQSKTRDWALYLDKKIQSLVCVETASERELK